MRRPLSGFLGALVLASVAPARAATVHSLDQVTGQLKTSEGKSVWRQQMAGKPGPDGLGVRLPPGLSATAIAAVLLPAGDRRTPSIIGAKPWPGQPGRLVAIVCTGAAAFDPSAPVCRRPDDEKGAPMRAYLGVIEAKRGQPPHLVARSGPVDGKIDWNSDMPAPEAGSEGGGIPLPTSVIGFDLAPFQIAPGQPAFGLRAAWITATPEVSRITRRFICSRSRAGSCVRCSPRRCRPSRTSRASGTKMAPATTRSPMTPISSSSRRIGPQAIST